LPQRQVLYFFCLSILEIIDFTQYMGFKGSFNRNYLRMKKAVQKKLNGFFLCPLQNYYQF
jgi:hypothetical protein